MPAPALNWPRIAWRGTIAGSLGALLFGLVLSAAGGRGYRLSPHFAEFAVLYVVVCTAWGIGYAYLAETQMQINRHLVLSGLSYGIVVYIVTQLVLYGIAAEQTHTAQQVAYGLAGTCLLFGLPVALVTRML